MNDITICPLKENYIDEIVAINKLSFHSIWDKKSYLEELNNGFARYVVAMKDNIVIGYGGMWVIIDEGHITNIAVHPEYRGNGIGSLIVQSLIDICIVEHVPSLTLEVRKTNFIAQNLYKKYGFTQEGLRKKYYGDNGEDAIIMWKRDIVS